MTRFVNLFLIFLLPTFFLASCLTKLGTIKHPCYGDEFFSDISRLSPSELSKLARMLEASHYPNQEKNGCRAALLGQVYFAQERVSLASEYFSEAAKKLPELANYFLLAKARTELKRRNFDQAQQIAYALLDSHTSVYSPAFALRVRRILADIAAQKKDDHQIIKTHQDLLKSGFREDEALLFNLATSLDSTGEHQTADEVYKRLLINFPASGEAKRALRLKSLAKYDLDLKQTEKRFDKLIEKLAFAQAVDDADKLLLDHNIVDNDEMRGQIESLAIKSLMLNNQFAQAYKRGTKNLAKKNFSVKELDSMAWTLGKIGRHHDAAAMYERVMHATKDKDGRAKACFFKGFSLYEASLYSMALFSWHQCRDEIKATAQFENYLWYQALASILSGSHQRALDHFKDLKTHFPKSKDEEKYTYFLAHTLRNMNKPQDADAILRELGHKKTPSYYVLLAQKAVGAADVKGQAITSDALAKLAQISSDGPSKNALILFHLGFKDEARDLVLASNALATDKLAMLQHLGFYHDAWQRSHQVAPTFEIAKGSVSTTKGIRARYPTPYRSLIDEFSRKYAVNKNLLYAIMQAESGFLENAVSFRGAVGLMQMMPFVAHDLAGRLAVEQFDQEQLKNPETAIELGALFVATLQRQFSNPHLVVAAYNAGPHQVQKWFDLFGHLPTELFVERVPFKQTRDYIKTVLHSESLYHAMTGKALRLSL